MNVVVPDSGTVTAPLILLVKAGTITGTVVNASGGAAISGATVKVTGTTTSTTTSSAGVFTLYQATGSYTLTVSKTGWVTTTTGSFSVTNNQTTDVGTIPFTQTATVTGTVKESGPGTVLASVSVKLHSDTSKTATTNSSGVFTLNGISVGTQSLDLSKSGYVSQTTASFAVVAGTNNVGDLLLVKSTGSITGVIQDAQAGNAGLPGATVTVNSVTPTISTTTAADGSYTLAGVPVGTRTVNASITGYTARNTASITVTQGQTATAANLALTRTTVSVTGTVTNSATAAPIASATVSVQEQSGKTATTNSSGGYTLSGVYWGSIHLAASKTSYTSQTVPLTLTPGNNATQNIALDPITGAISGTVTDTQAGGGGLAGATVTVNSVTPVISTTTAANGTYTLTGVPVGTRTINASATNYVAANSGNVTVTANQTSTGINRSLNRTTVSVSGTVTDSTTNATIAGATVGVQEQSGKNTGTDGSGYYSLTGVYWGDVHLQVSADSYTTKTVPVGLAAGTTPTQDVTLDSAFGRITGTILDASTQLGLPDVTVVLTDDTGIGSGVDGFGNFTLENVPIGSHSLTVSRDRYATVTTDPIAVNPGTTTAPVIAMTPDRCSISGIVRDGSTGGGFAGATVTAAREGQTTTTDEWGAFTLSGLAPGAELLAVTADGYAPITTDVFVLNAGDTPTDWVLDVFPPGDRTLGIVHGTVRDASGSPLAGATVGLVGGASTTSAADGTYSITAHGGRYALVASKAGFRTIFTPNHGNGPTDSDRPWQIQQDFVLPGAGDTATLDITAHDPVLLTEREADFWLWTPTAAYRILVPSSGHRTLTGIPAGPLYGLAYPVQLGSGATVALDVHAPPTLPSTSPRWSACGIVVRETTRAPISGAAVTLTNPDASFTTTATTDANGRWSFSGGPLGEYSVEFSGPEGLTRPDPWTFTADEDGFYLTDIGLLGPGDTGTITCSSPASGTTLSADLTHVDCTATLPRLGDYIVTAATSLSNGQVQAQTPTFDLDGRAFHLDITSSWQNGPQEIYISALARFGGWIDLTIPVTVALPVVPAQVVLDPAEISGGAQTNGTVILNVVAPPGGQVVTLLSSNAAVASTPDTVTVNEGSDRAGFPVTALPQTTSTSVTISASANGGTSSATLSVTPSTFGTIFGQVVDAVTGEGLSEVTVVLSDDTGIAVGVDWDGRFVIPNVTVGVHSVFASHDGYSEAMSTEVEVTPAAASSVPPIALSPNPATILGTLSAVGGSPGIPGATITAARSGQTTTTDGDGNFTLTGLAPGYEIIVATKDGYPPSASNEIPLYPGQTVGMGLDIFDGGTRPIGVIHGTVRDSSGVPLSGATVTVAGGPTMVTESDGTYSTSLPGGRYVLRAEKGGYRTAISRNHGDGPLWNSNWQIQQDFVLNTPNETAVVNIQQTDPVLLTPAAGRAWMQTLFGTYAADTPASGQRTLATVPAGRLLGWTVPLDLQTGGDVSLNFTNGAGPIETSPHWVAGGLVYRATTSEAIPGATVTLTNAGAGFTATETTDANGRWSFQSGPTGDYAVSVAAEGNLAFPDTWTFTAQDDNGGYFRDLGLLAPAETGTLAIDSPASGSVLPGGLIAVSCTATLPRPGDYIGTAQVTLSQGQVQSQNVVYDLDGRHFRIDVTAAVANGPLTVTVGARTWYGRELTASTAVAIESAPVPVALTLAPPAIVGGYPSTGTVSLGAVAGPGGVVVGLQSSNPGVAEAPATVTVLEGSSSVQFTVITTPVGSATSVTFSASAGGFTQTALLTVQPLSVTAVSVNPENVFGGTSANGTVTINSAALSGGFTVTLASSAPLVAAVPPSTTVSEGATDAQFTVTTAPAASSTSITISASGGGATRTAALVVGPLSVASVVISPSTVIGGNSSTGVVTLNGAAPPGGFTVALTSSSPGLAVVPDTVVVSQGAVSAQFVVTTSVVNSQVPVTISASGGGSSQNASLQVIPLQVGWFTPVPNPIVGGNTIQLLIGLTGTAPAGGAVVALTTSNPAVVPLPQSVTVDAGTTGVVVAVVTAFVSLQTEVVVSASLGDQTATLTLQVNPIVLTSIQLDHAILGGASTTGMVSISTSAPPGGVMVAMFSSAPAVATIPSAVAVAAGQTSCWFHLSTAEVTTPTAVQVQASLLGQNLTANITINPLGPKSILCQPAVGGYDSSCSLYINGVAPTGGVVVDLTSDNAAVQVPATVTVPEGTDHVSVVTSTLPVASLVTVTLTAATPNGVSVQGSFGVSRFGPLYMTFNPPMVAAGTSSVGVVRLNAPAPSGGLVVALSSDNPVATVPGSVNVAAGSAWSDNFTVTTGGSDAATATITATANDVSVSGALTIAGEPTLSAVTVPSPSGAGGAIRGMVRIDGVAPVGGAVVDLTSDNPGVATVPASVTIPVNASTVYFQVATTAVTTPTPVVISATLHDVTKSATLQLVPLEVTELRCLETTLHGGIEYLANDIQLNAYAPDPGPSITLTSSDPTGVAVPASVVVDPGSSSANFPIHANPVATTKTTTITASWNGTAKSITITVEPAPMIWVAVTPSTVPRGGSGIVTVALDGLPLSQGLTVAFESSDPTIASVPATATTNDVEFTPGPFGGLSPVTAWRFPILTTSPTSPGGTVTISATYLGVTRTAPLTVTVPDGAVILGQVTGVSSLHTVPGGPLAGATVTISGTANWTTTDDAGRFTLVQPAGTYTLTVSKGGLTTATTGPFQAASGTTVDVGTITLFYAGSVVGSVVNAADQTPLAGVTVSTSGLSTVTDQSGNFLLAVPEGAFALTFSMPGFVTVVSDPTLVTFGQVVDFFQVLLQPLTNPPTIASLSVSPQSVGGGQVVNGQVGLSAPAPSGGMAVSLTSSNPSAAPVPATVNVAGGATSASFAVTVGHVASATPVTITSSLVGSSATATLTVLPWIASLDLNPADVIGGEPATGAVTMSLAAPTGGVTVDLASSDPSTANVPASVTVMPGGTSAPFQVTTQPVSSPASLTITATVGGESTEAILEVVPVALTSVALSPTSVTAGGSSVGTVALGGPAPAGGANIALSSSDIHSATVPTTVTVAAGTTSATFTVTTLAAAPSSSVTISAIYGGMTKTTTLALAPPPLTGVAPGWVLPGDTNVVVYGSNLTQGTSILMAGPVYSLTDEETPLCQVSPAQCPTTTMSATANSDGTALSFSAPPGSAPGIYYLQTQGGGGATSPNGVWLAIDEAQKTYPALAPGHDSTGRPIWSGQTITGSFVAGGDPSGLVADLNTYFFVATAGSTIDVTLNRLDTTRAWEHPDSLDPQIVIVAPDGLVYQNLVALDNQPGVDLNASLRGAVLPLSGLYLLCVQTTKGFGDYQMQFAITSMAPASTRVFPIADNLVTVPVGETTNPTAILLDPRGYRISSANVTFALTPSPDDTGTVDFTGGATVQTAPDGTAWTTVTATSVGKISYAPDFVDTFATSVASGSGLRVTIDAVDTQNVQRIPRYQAVAWQPFAVAGFNVDGAARLSTGKYQHLPIEKAHRRRQAAGTVSVPELAAPVVKLQSGAAMPRPIVSQPTDRVALAGGPGPEVVDASTAVPLPEPKARLVASTQSLTSCGDAKVVQENVPAGTVLHPPYTVTLTDNTPPTGGTAANGVVGADGIHGHRVGKTISLQLDIKDANGAAPTYPVLVQLNSVGVRHGAIILGPDGEAVTCPSASLVWQPTDAQGEPFANVVRYQLGTLSLYVGVQPDPNNSSQILPVWGSAESLVVLAEAKATGQPTATSTVMVGVHPQPWQPDHFLCIEDGAECPDLFEYWNGYQLDAESSPASSMPMVLLNAYFLKDMYENTVYGCTDTSATQPGSGITVGFTDQTAADTEGDPAGYTLSTKWLMDPGPTGTPHSTLSVNYPQDPDNDWCSGTVSREVTYQFDGGPTHLLVQAQSYEKRLEDMGQTVVDGPMPLIVAPGAIPFIRRES